MSPDKSWTDILQQFRYTEAAHQIIHASDGQPETGSPQMHVRTTIRMIIKKDTTQKITPITEASDNGATENPVIPSRE